jgi:hypothetical protein
MFCCDARESAIWGQQKYSKIKKNFKEKVDKEQWVASHPALLYSL